MVLAILLTAIATFLISEAAGFSIHRLAHWPKAGKIYRDHLYHHAEAYPPSRFLSQEYRGNISTSFVPYFVPIFLGFNLTAWFFLSLPLFLTFLAVSSLVSLTNVYLHDAMHIDGHPLERFGWFSRLQGYHWYHHKNVRRNLGIYFFGFDRVLGSFSGDERRIRLRR